MRLLYLIFIQAYILWTSAEDVPKLRFLKEPPSTVSFANSTGSKIGCTAEGNPQPKISWTLVDGSIVTNIPDVRTVTDVGELMFYPFGAETYRPDVHFAVYRCTATNSAGTIRSRDVNVHGVIEQSYEAQVYDVFAIDGNSAVLKCHLPAVIADYVKVIGWIKNDKLLIQPAAEEASGIYEMMPNGDLHVRNVSAADSAAKYKCKTKNILTGETRVNPTAGRLFVTESHGNIQPKIFQSVSSLLLVPGEKAILPCVVQGNPLPNLKWLRKNKTGNLIPVTYDNNFAYLEGSLIVKNAQILDSGIYVCEASNENGKDFYEVKVTVAESLSVSITPILQVSKMEDSVTFICETNSPKTAAFSWLHNGSPIAQETGNKLTIDGVKVSDQGMYQCLVKSGIGMVQASAQLRLSEVIPYYEQTFQEVTRKPQESFTVKCVASGIPLPKVSWTLDDLPLNNTSRIRISSSINKNGMAVSTLKIEQLAVEDGGLYACVATNNVGEAQFSARINVVGQLSARNAMKKIAVSGGNLYLNCPVYGYPIDELTWSRGSSKILPLNLRYKTFENGTLWIKNVQRHSDGGMYNCKAKNSLNQEVTSGVDVQVIVPPKLVPFEFQDELLREGMRARLQCVVSEGELPLNVTWLKDGEPLSPELRVLVKVLDEFSSILTINSITPAHNGKYTCVATNRAATASHTAELSVNVPPKIIPFGFLDDQFYKGMRAHVTCAVSQGDLPVTFEWLKDGAAIPAELGVATRKYDANTESLSIENVSSQHSGNYSCIVRNSAGTAKHTAPLLVRVAPKIVPFRFGDLHYEGTPARVVCGLQEGDTPIQFSWLHDNVPLPPSSTVSVHDVDGLSSILSIGSLSAGHSGTYTCIAKNGAGVDRYEAVLRVNVPPKIVPFAFQDDSLVEGLLARVSCVVSRGDLPLKLHWEINGVEVIPGVQGVLVRSFDEHSSILSITEVNSKHNGLYTCIASNGAGSARHSAQLVVKVPPKWVIEPKGMQVINGAKVVMDCQSDGYPKPSIQWMFSKGFETLDNELNLLSDSENLKIAENGSLVIQKVNTENEGYYLCRASNGIGIPLDAAVQIKINAPPNFKQQLSLIRSVVGKNIQYKCETEGDMPMIVSWYKENKELKIDNERMTIQTINQSSSVLSTLTIHKIAREDNGKYQCVAKNKYGANNTSGELMVLESPDAPTDVKIASKTSTAIEITWNLRYDGNDAIKKFIIQYKKETESWDDAVTMETVNGQPTNSIVAHLHPDTSYLFRLFAENALGRSRSSQILHATTNEDVPMGPPLNVQVETINAETFKILWQMPEKKFWNGKILGFYIGYKEVDAEDSYRFKTLLTPDPNESSLSVQISGLLQFKKYAVVVLAYNSQGKGPTSEPVIVMTSEGAPSQSPTDVRCTTLTSESIHVTWTAPPAESINGILNGFKVSYKPAADWFDSSDKVEVASPTASSLTLNKMEKFTNYSIEVLAMTKTGDGPRSIPIFCKTLDDVPESPVHVKVVATSQDSVMVSWKQPENPNGVIRSYSLYWKDVKDTKDPTVQSFSPHTKNYEVSRLHKDHQYEFWMTASTSAGEGSPSKVFRQSPVGPNVPAKVISFDDKLVQTWKSDVILPCVAVGIPKPKISWMVAGKILENGGKLKIGTDGSLSIKNILEEDAGNYACSAQNELATDTITYTILVLAPPAAPSVEVLMTTSSTIEIQWRNPSNKNSRIKGYTVQIRKEFDDEWKEINLASDLTSYKLTQLECGKQFEVVVSAFNRIGRGPPSDTLMVATNGSVPAPPTKFDLIEETSNSVSLYLNTWKSNGCPILYFVVEYAPRSSNEWSVVSGNVKPEQRRLVIPGLKSGTWYGLRMTAHNSAGSYVAEYDFSTLTFSGATISPDIQSDAANEEVEGLMVYLNFYLIVPIACTVIVLVAILAAACFYLKTKKRDRTNDIADNRSSITSADLKPGARSGSFSYMQRGTLNRSVDHSRLADDELTPYATFQLGNHVFGTLGRGGNGTPPLPPPRFDGFNSNMAAPESQYTPSGSGFIPGHHGPVETTFIFPHLQGDESLHGAGNYSQNYPNEVTNN